MRRRGVLYGNPRQNELVVIRMLYFANMLRVNKTLFVSTDDFQLAPSLSKGEIRFPADRF